jgi:peptidoglycan/LPS O-acetylase OafA/YrhL
MKNAKKTVGIFQLVVGTGMLGIWMLSFHTGKVNELQTEVFRIAMHLLAEVLTALSLLISGGLILFSKRKHPGLFYGSFGALIYSLIASPGYFAQRGDWAVVFLFIVLLVMSVGLLILSGMQD